MSFDFSVLNPPKVDAIIVAGRQGDQGIPGPNQVTNSTSSNLNGVLVADGNKVREALPGEVVDASALQAALVPIESSVETLDSVKANASDVTASLALKANTSDVASSLSAKASVSDVTILASQITSIANAQASGRVAYLTYAAMIADTSQTIGTIGEVGANETDEELRGIYQWDGTFWLKDENAIEPRVSNVETQLQELGIGKDLALVDFAIVDELGNAVLVIRNGVVEVNDLRAEGKSLGFVAASVGSEFSSADFAFTDEAGNIAAFLRNGVLYAKDFTPAGGEKLGSLAITHRHPIAPLVHILNLGQSNGSGGNATIPSITGEDVFDSITVNVQSNPTAMVSSSNPSWERPMYNAATQIKRTINKESNIVPSDYSYQFYVSNAAIAETRIEDLIDQAKTSWDLLTKSVSFGIDYGAVANKKYNCTAAIFTHGEANALDSSGYADSQLEYFEQINSYVKSTSGQSNDVMFFTWLLSRSAYIAREQIKAADSHPNIFIACPSYPFPYYDGVHVNALGSAMLGAYYGRAIKRVIVDGQEWEPLRPRVASARGNRVTILFNKRGLEFDTESLPAQTHYGFSISDAAGSPTITSVSIVNGDAVLLTLDREVSGAAVVKYGVTMFGRSDPYSGHGGNLRDNAGAVEKTEIAGTEYPLHNWAINFEMEV